MSHDEAAGPHRVKGIGGVFIRAADTAALGAWYREHLGIAQDDVPGMHVFRWQKADDGDGIAPNPVDGSTTWALFPEETSYFGDSSNTTMVNYRVDDLDAVLAALRSEGVEVDDHVEEHEYGRFGWATDPEGNRIELWQPAPGQ